MQQIVGELDVGLVDLVDQQDRAALVLKGFPELSLLDVVLDVLDPLIAELAVPQAGDGVIFVEAHRGLGGRLDVPGDQLRAERLGDFLGKHGLAGAGLTLDQERALQGDGGVDRHLEVFGGDVIVSPGKTLAHLGSPRGRSRPLSNSCLSGGNL